MAGKTYEDFLLLGVNSLKSNYKISDGSRCEYIFIFRDESFNCNDKCRTKIVFC